MWGSIRAGAGFALVVVLSACSGAVAPPSAAPATIARSASPPTPAATSATQSSEPSPTETTAQGTLTPSPTATASPSPSPIATAASGTLPPGPAATRPAATRQPGASAKPRPSFDSAAIAAYLTASITLFDLTDADLSVSVTYLDSGGQTASLGTYLLGSSEQIAHAVPAGTYRLDFRQPAGATTGSSCAIAVKDGAAFTFIAVPGAIAVSRSGFTPKTARDLFIATSPLCRT
jgi:hypothetical protein